LTVTPDTLKITDTFADKITETAFFAAGADWATTYVKFARPPATRDKDESLRFLKKLWDKVKDADTLCSPNSVGGKVRIAVLSEGGKIEMSDLG
jgi:hypothetical protein